MEWIVEVTYVGSGEHHRYTYRDEKTAREAAEVAGRGETVTATVLSPSQA